jgi:hypothetical protein
MGIKIETLKSEYERAAETDVFRTGDTANKQTLTPHTDYKYLYVVFTVTPCINDIKHIIVQLMHKTLKNV